MDDPTMRANCVVLEQAEIMVIMLEEVFHARRPEGMTALQALQQISLPPGPPEIVEGFRNALTAAANRIVEYVVGEIAKSVPGTVHHVINGPEGRMQ